MEQNFIEHYTAFTFIVLAIIFVILALWSPFRFMQ
jgi:hypothetical protein